MTKRNWAGALALLAALGCNQIEEPAPAEKNEEPPPKAAEPAPQAAEAKAERTKDGYDVVRAKTAEGETTEVEVKAPEGWKVAQPPSMPDPRGGKFALKDALRDLPGKQPLV